MGIVNQWLWLLPALAQSAVAVRVIASGAARQYILLLALMLTSVALAVFGSFGEMWVGARSYAFFWVAAYVWSWSFTALALTEACTRSLQSYPRFAQVGHRIAQTVLTATGLLIAGWLLFAPRSWAPHFLLFLQAQGHLVHASLAVLGLSVIIFAKWSRLRLRTNASRTMTILTVFCIGEAILGSGVSAAWPSMAFYLGIVWASTCWSTLAATWSASEAAVAADDRCADEIISVAPELAQMESTNNRLTDLLRRG
jgi:hypothetical protein